MFSETPKMQCLLTIFFVGTIANTTIATFLSSVLDNTVDSLVVTTKKSTSDTINAGCKLFAETVKEYPIKEPTIDDVSFQFRTPCGRKEFPVSEAGKLAADPEFDVNRKTVVIVTGWRVTPDKEYVAEMAKAYHCRGNYNFIIVNTGGTISNEYINSAYHTRKLGVFVAVGLQNLGIPIEFIHLIGHSLGAQIVGSTARYYLELTGEKLKRITGLDPARPCFLDPVVFPRIGRDDAEFVDIIHSNPTDLGTEDHIGHVDFYAGGLDVIKPGCSDISLLCSHERAIFYFIESVYPTNEMNFVGTQCSSYSDLKNKSCNGSTAIMGYASDASLRGIYYLEVRDKPPYGMNANTEDTSGAEACGLCATTR